MWNARRSVDGRCSNREGAVKEQVKCPPGMAQAPDQSCAREASSPRGQVSLQHRDEAETWPAADVRGRHAYEVHERRRGHACLMQVILRCDCSLVRLSGTQSEWHTALCLPYPRASTSINQHQPASDPSAHDKAVAMRTTMTGMWVASHGTGQGTAVSRLL